MMMVLFSRWYGVPTYKIEIAGIALGFIGVLLLVRGQGFAASPIALAAMCVSVIGWTLGSVFSRRQFPLAPGTMGYASEMLFGGIAMSLIALVLGERVQWPPLPSAALAWAYLVVFGSLIAFNAYCFC